MTDSSAASEMPGNGSAGNGVAGNLFRASAHRNYRLFFGGQGISLIGTWMTRVATSWLVYDPHRARIGCSASSALPGQIPILADHAARRRVGRRPQSAAGAGLDASGLDDPIVRAGCLGPLELDRNLADSSCWLCSRASSTRSTLRPGRRFIIEIVDDRRDLEQRHCAEFVDVQRRSADRPGDGRRSAGRVRGPSGPVGPGRATASSSTESAIWR